MVWIVDIFTEEEKEAFKDPVYYKQFRQALESELNVRRLFIRPALTN